MNDKPRNDLSYDEAMHGMQAGVATDMGPGGSQDTSPKHLRVGVNSALINDAALVRLLIKKGLFTTEEYVEEVRLEANRELDRYEDKLSKRFGSKITLR